VLPVNFVLVDGDVMFRTVAGTKFHAAAGGAAVAFEADGWDHSGQDGWSVLVQGTATVVTNPAQLADVRFTNLDPWAVDGSADRVVRIQTVRVSGRRFHRRKRP
jgi:nitroimidazol reductase NimA-like FMN-containing flavoprotein (pyridoxamine 5'-phosphate oxidase superfamily)